MAANAEDMTPQQQAKAEEKWDEEVEMAMKESKPKKMADELKQLGENWAYVVRAATVVLIGPGEAFNGSPMLAYSENDLKEAVRQGLLQKKNWQVHDHTAKSWTLEVYVSP